MRDNPDSHPDANDGAAEKSPRDRFAAFFEGPYCEAAETAACAYPQRRSLRVDWTDLKAFDRRLARDYIEDPGDVRAIAENALMGFDQPHIGELNMRVHNLPESQTYRVGKIPSRRLGELISIEAEVIDIEGDQPLTTHAVFECERCGGLNRLPQTPGPLRNPSRCESCECEEADTFFRFIKDESTIIDHQEVTVVTPDSTLDKPPEEPMFLRRDRVNSVGPSDNIRVVGTYEVYPNPSTAIMDTFIRVHALDHEDQHETDSLSMDELEDKVFETVEDYMADGSEFDADKEEVIEGLASRGIRREEIRDALDNLEADRRVDEHKDGRLMTIP